MKKFLILIDGPKGSGKSTLSNLLRNRLQDIEFFSLDTERGLLKRTSSIENDNKAAFHNMVEKSKAAFALDKHVVIDSGLSVERIATLEKVSRDYGVHVHKFSLIAPYTVLHSRVRERDEIKGKDFDKNRFDYTLQAQQSKSFDDFCVIDSDKLSPQEILEVVLKHIS
ncbi:MAG: AAA family ATPase [Candidatus Kaiserbacteria bacterium]|nr:AAA family ATPase [Candidatus Kaiserbacteria bacterium]